MMKTNWIPTNDYYHRLLKITDSAERQQAYIEWFIKPWEHMMSMMRGSGFGPNTASDDPLAGARAWAWLLPDQTDQIAETLEKMDAANAWDRGREAFAYAASRFNPYANHISFNEVSGWLLLADPAKSNPLERGYTGATDWFQPRIIGQFWEPNDYNLPRVSGLVAHELHHLIRRQVFPWNIQHVTVAEYIVLEGMAESFAASLFGEDCVEFFITEFDPNDLEIAREMTGKGLHETGFNKIRSYIFGDALAERSGYKPLGGMPTYSGYVVGYHVVQQFLKRTGLTIEEATFLPAAEIVTSSGYFD
jgi:uncharacterized protein YjaZ